LTFSYRFILVTPPSFVLCTSCPRAIPPPVPGAPCCFHKPHSPTLFVPPPRARPPALPSEVVLSPLASPSFLEPPPFRYDDHPLVSNLYDSPTPFFSPLLSQVALGCTKSLQSFAETVLHRQSPSSPSFLFLCFVFFICLTVNCRFRPLSLRFEDFSTCALPPPLSLSPALPHLLHRTCLQAFRFSVPGPEFCHVPSHLAFFAFSRPRVLPPSSQVWTRQCALRCFSLL